jgi:hypothetical protein
LPDGILIFKPKISIRVIFEGIEMKDNGIFYGHLVYFTAILVYFVAVWYILWPLWYILWPFGIFCGHYGIFGGHLVYYYIVVWYIILLFGIFSRFGMLYQEKSGNPGGERTDFWRMTANE